MNLYYLLTTFIANYEELCIKFLYVKYTKKFE